MKGSQSQATGLFIFLRQLQQYWRILSQDKPALISFWILVLFIGVAVTAPWLPLADPKEFTMVQYARPGTQYWMGTDNLSRDLFSRVIWGGRLGLLVAVVSAGIASVLGVVVGGLAGYYGGWVDDVLSRVIDIFLMIPTFFLALLIIRFQHLPYHGCDRPHDLAASCSDHAVAGLDIEKPDVCQGHSGFRRLELSDTIQAHHSKWDTASYHHRHALDG